MVEKRKATSLKISPSVWRKARSHCIETSKEVSQWIEDLIKKELNIK